MGFFSKGTSTESTNKQSNTTFDKALSYFDDQQLRYKCTADRKAIEEIYKTLKEDNYDTSDDNNLVSAISSLDANIYNLCKAIINQNFMLMRKVDELNDRLEELEKEKNI